VAVPKEGTSSGVKTSPRILSKTALPPMYRVLMHNDDYTTMDFVVEMLRQVFHKSEPEANQIMLNVHHKGQGVCGVYSYEVAETKVSQVHNLARKTGFPLRCSLDQV
jgi:ATP-dependent Clp protease adaptor protein ClpS